MIKGVHTMFYSSKADESRNFLRDKLGLKSTDIGDEWLIFDLYQSFLFLINDILIEIVNNTENKLFYFYLRKQQSTYV